MLSSFSCDRPFIIFSALSRIRSPCSGSTFSQKLTALCRPPSPDAVRGGSITTARAIWGRIQATQAAAAAIPVFIVYSLFEEITSYRNFCFDRRRTVGPARPVLLHAPFKQAARDDRCGQLP